MRSCVCDQNKGPIENDRPYNYVLTVNFVVSTSFIAIAAAAAATAAVIDYYIILRIFGHWKKCVRLLCGLTNFFGMHTTFHAAKFKTLFYCQ